MTLAEAQAAYDDACEKYRIARGDRRKRLAEKIRAAGALQAVLNEERRIHRVEQIEARAP